MADTVRHVDPSEMEALIQRVERAIEHDLALDAADMRLLLDAIHTLIDVQTELTNKGATLLKLKKLLGMVRSSETRGNASRKRQSPTSSPAPSSTTEPDKAHHAITRHQKGDICPGCGKGKLAKAELKTTTRVRSQAPFAVTTHILERLTCTLCGYTATADLPESVRQNGAIDQRYGYSARSMMAIAKHFSGTPVFHRQSLNTLFGCPITASTLFDQCEYVANDAHGAYKSLKRLAATAIAFYIDDTRHRILDAKPELRPRRKGEGQTNRYLHQWVDRGAA